MAEAAGAAEGGPTVLVVGAGPVGLACAIECLRFGLHVRIVDKATTRDPYSKALGLHARTLEHYMGMGVLPAVLQEAVAWTTITARSALLRASFGLGSIQSRFKAVYSLSQRRLEEILEAHLELYGGKIERGVEFLGLEQSVENGPASEGGGKGVRVRLRDAGTGQESWVACKYLVGADGAHSAVRKSVGVAFEGAAYPEEFCLLDGRLRLRPGAPPLGAAMFVGDPVLACLPLGADTYRLISSAPSSTPSTPTTTTPNGGDDGIVHGPVPASPQQETKTPDGNSSSNEHHPDKFPSGFFKAGVGPGALDTTAAAYLLSLLKARCPELEAIEDVEWSARFRIHRRLASKYRVGHVFLMGDAAHIHSPVGGQGLNTGTHDAVNLAWKLALVERCGADPEALLPTYEEERRPAGAATLSVTDSLTKSVFARGLVQTLARFALFPIMPFVLSRDVVARRLVRWMSMMTVSVRGSSLVRGEGAFPAAAPLPGDRLPDGPLVRMSSGGSTGLLEATCRGLRHTLLLFGDRPTATVGGSGLGPIVGSGEEEEGLRRFADVVACVHVSRAYYLPPPPSSSSSSSKGAVNVEALYDVDGKVSEAFGLLLLPPGGGKRPMDPCLFLVRPDGYIALRAVGWGLAPVLAYLETVFRERKG